MMNSSIGSAQNSTAPSTADGSLVTGPEVGRRVSEKVRASLGSIRLGSEILMSKVRNPNGNLRQDVEALHLEIVDFCESIGYYLDLRVPGGQTSGSWTQFDAFDEIRGALTRTLERSGCLAHIAGPPQLLTFGTKRDFGRLVFEAVDNAVRHGLARNIWVTIGSDPGTSQATLTIEDDGQGFLYRETCDDGFCLRLESETMRSKGVGILVCRRILSRYDGRIDFAVRREGGLRVEIRWSQDLKKPVAGSVLSPFGLQVEE